MSQILLGVSLLIIIVLAMAATSLLDDGERVLALGSAKWALIVGVRQVTHVADLGFGVTVFGLRWLGHLRLSAHALSISLSMTKGKRSGQTPLRREPVAVRICSVTGEDGLSQSTERRKC